MKTHILLIFLTLIFALSNISAKAQASKISGRIMADSKALESVSVGIPGTPYGTYTDTEGNYYIEKIPAGNYNLLASSVGFTKQEVAITLTAGQHLIIDFDFTNSQSRLQEVVVTGTLKEVNRLESPVPVEVYNPTFFRKNPTPSVFDALQNVNGVRPQLNCNVCNTGDIHINGLEGPYTMVLIDGMPIVSSLSTVYGLSGIPNSLIERIEIVKGPASSLYGSEAVGGLINIITKKPQNAPLISADVFATSWLEYNADLGIKFKAGERATALTGINYYNYNNIVDNNQDNFTDVTLQNRISVFQKWNFERNSNRLFSVVGRYFYEDRWGGDTRWTPAFRGGDSIYGESIYTSRWEFIGNYQLPVQEKVLFSFSYNNHDQNSVYGNTSYNAQQNITYAQLTWDKTLGRNDFLVGLASRYTFYDDNTPATATVDVSGPQTRPDITFLPGIFVQDEISLTARHKVLLGLRYDYNSVHGNIYTPRIAYKWSLNDQNILRLNAGTGFRVVNLFTEEHASLTGARQIEVKDELAPEKSYNANLNYIKKIYSGNGTFIGLDATAFYTFFNNKIIPDYDTDPNLIIYENLVGYAVSSGLSANLDIEFKNGLKVIAGGTYLDVFTVEDGHKEQQILTEHFTGTWAVSYKIKHMDLSVDYTGNLYSPMRLPLLGDLDPRQSYSPWWSIQNIQLTYNRFRNFELYGGIKNLLNWTPNKGNPFIIARANDPFDKEVSFNERGQAVPTANNPYGLTFDPTYVYAPNQGLRGFLGVRLTIN